MSGIVRDIDSLRPEAQKQARTWLHVVRQDLQIDARIIETLRTEERQAEVAAAKASKSLVGWHNVGLAWDFACFQDGVYQKDDKFGLYKRCGMVGMALGCRWGGNWDQDTTFMEAGENDLDHLEYHPGFTLQQFLNGQKGGIVP